MKGDLLLAIDNGTQSVRALVFDLQGNLVAKSRVPIEPYFSTAPGLAEQDPEVFWESVCLACRELWKDGVITPDRICGVAVTTQRSTVINVDRNGKPLRPAIVWLDQRRTRGLKPVSGLWGLGFWLVGMTETVAYLQAEAEANWIRTNQPDIWSATHKYLYLSGYLAYKLTGNYSDSIGSQVGYMPFDYKNLTWAKTWDWKWQAVPMDARVLPELIPPAGILGEITAHASEATGIPTGVPLIAAAADKACEVLGSGCLESDIACISYGTTATINITSKKYLEVIPLIPPYPSAAANRYSLEIGIYRGYWMVSWFKQEFGLPETYRANQLGIEPESLFDDLVKDIPAGSQGLVLLPYWSPGLKLPGPEAKGAIIGFGDVHSRAHLYRAILEGVAYGLREGLETITNRTRMPIKEILVAGGGSQSKVAMQLTADIFGLPAANPHTFEASGLGAAIDSAVGLKLYPDFKSAVGGMTRRGQLYEPSQKAHELYNALFKKVYQKIYRRLQPLYEEIRDITGYPPNIYKEQ